MRVPARIPIDTIKMAQAFARMRKLNLCDVIDHAIVYYLNCAMKEMTVTK